MANKCGRHENVMGLQTAYTGQNSLALLREYENNFIEVVCFMLS